MGNRPRLSVLQDIDVPGFNDGVVAAWGPGDAYLVTSPNAPYIPPVAQGLVSVHLHDDGCFGGHDPVQWLQMYTSQYPYLATLPKGPSPSLTTDAASIPTSPMWTHPSPDRFIELPNTPVRGFGRWAPEVLRPLEPLVSDMSSRTQRYISQAPDVDLHQLRRFQQDMTMAWLRLRDVSSTYRDQVMQLATVRRNWLFCSSFMTYYELLGQRPSLEPIPVNEQFMGAWTSQPMDAQRLFALGIPVWFVRASHVVSSDIRIRQYVTPLSISDLCDGIPAGDVPVYRGLAGPRHLKSTFTIPSYVDLAPNVVCGIPPVDDNCFAPSHHEAAHMCAHRTYPAPTQQRIRRRPGKGQTPVKRSRCSPYEVHDLSEFAHPSQVRGRDKFRDVPHPWMPPSLSSWDAAMLAVDRSGLAKDTEDTWGYWIPEPALLLGPKDSVRLQRYVLNWLRAQPVWVYMLQIPGSGTVQVSPQSWRNFLNGVPDDPNFFTRTGKRAFEIKQIFGCVFPDNELNPSADGEVVWHQHRLASVSDDMAPMIIWETFELGFRYELWALDRAQRPLETPDEESHRTLRVARVFPSQSLWVVPELPTEDLWGLFAPIPHRRVHALNALRDILTAWPKCPRSISDAPPLRHLDFEETIVAYETSLACFYAQSFFDTAGRAPIVPHRYPEITT